MEKHDLFIASIERKLILIVKVSSKEKGLITRNCIPYDFGPSRKYKDELNRYHFYDLDSPDGKHNLSILPEQLEELTLTELIFDPANYITWKTEWFIKRDWGIYS